MMKHRFKLFMSLYGDNLFGCCLLHLTPDKHCRDGYVHIYKYIILSLQPPLSIADQLWFGPGPCRSFI